MSWLVDLKVLTATEVLEVADALWGEDYDGHDELPIGTDIYDWGFLVLPEPRLGLAEERFRAKWLNAEPSAESSLPGPSDVLRQVGSAICNLQIHGRPLSLSAEERSYLAHIVERWAETPPPPPFWLAEQSAPLYRGGADEEVRNAISGLQYVLLEVSLSEAVANTLYDKVQGLNKSEMPARTLFAGLIRALPERFEEIVQLVRMGLASDDDRAANDAVAALEFWLQPGRGTTAGLVPPPTDLVREIGVIIANRRKAALLQALRVARWVFSEGTAEQRAAIGNLATQGLGYLAEELRYDRQHDEDIDVPLLRWGCAHLAIAMAEHGFADEFAIARWMENARDDPLPEVRHASGLTSA